MNLDKELETFLELKYGFSSIIRNHERKLKLFHPDSNIHIFRSEVNGNLLIRVDVVVDGKTMCHQFDLCQHQLESMTPEQLENELITTIGGMVMAIYKMV